MWTIRAVVLSLIAAGCSGQIGEEGGLDPSGGAREADPDDPDGRDVPDDDRVDQDGDVEGDPDPDAADGGDVEDDGELQDEPAGASPTITLRAPEYRLEAGEEVYRCSWMQLDDVPEGSGVRTLAPVGGEGLHHVALFATSGEMEEDRDCWSIENGWSILGGAGIGTGATELPDGVAVPVREGSVVLLQRHMLNATGDTIDVGGGYDLGLTAPDEAWERAGLLNVTTVQIAIPPETTGHQVETGCAGRLPDGARLVNIFPHMHRRGVRFVAELVSDGARSTLYEGGWQFEDQAVVPFEPVVPVTSEDAVRIRCTWDNPTDEWIGFGESTDDEMCGASFYYAPANDDEIRCIE